MCTTERNHSHEHQTYTKLRNRLSDEKVDILAHVNLNGATIPLNRMQARFCENQKKKIENKKKRPAPRTNPNPEQKAEENDEKSDD